MDAQGWDKVFTAAVTIFCGAGVAIGAALWRRARKAAAPITALEDLTAAAQGKAVVALEQTVTALEREIGALRGELSRQAEMCKAQIAELTGEITELRALVRSQGAYSRAIRDGLLLAPDGTPAIDVRNGTTAPQRDERGRFVGRRTPSIGGEA